MKWIEEEEKFLKEKYVEKIPLENIASELNRSRHSIKRKAQEMNLHRKWIRFNKPPKIFSKGDIDKRYYQNNKKKVYQRKMKRRKRLKVEAVEIAGGKCKICGYNKCFAALEFHHPKNDKENNVSAMLKNESRQKLLKEAEKCILLCANCHRELHFNGRVG